MADDVLVAAFLREHVSSHEQLEVLVHLHREGAAAPTAIAEKTRIPEGEVRRALGHLCAHGLVSDLPDGRYAYRPSTPLLAARVEELAAAVAQRRVDVMKIMSANAIERVRTSALRAFADAFVIEKRKKDG